mmetsp:Transcript_34550/g.136111  ORF Transcript_34550/g.136111 Transcript_34550/m.136111 type:complete len:187 (-) Transcript_34550:2483-3043(-)
MDVESKRLEEVVSKPAQLGSNFSKKIQAVKVTTEKASLQPERKPDELKVGFACFKRHPKPMVSTPLSERWTNSLLRLVTFKDPKSVTSNTAKVTDASGGSTQKQAVSCWCRKALALLPLRFLQPQCLPLVFPIFARRGQPHISSSEYHRPRPLQDQRRQSKKPRDLYRRKLRTKSRTLRPSNLGAE